MAKFAGPMERRRYERYRLVAELDFFWEELGHTPRSARGRVRDISPKGIFVLSDDAPPSGADVRIQVAIRSILARARLAILANGRVIRVETHTAKAKVRGFATVIGSLVLCNEKGEVLEISVSS